MCLRKVTHTTEATEWIEAWKVMDIRTGPTFEGMTRVIPEAKTPVYYHTIPFSQRTTAEINHLLAGDGQMYYAGYHCFTNKADAEQYRQVMNENDDDPDLEVRKVYLHGKITYGTQILRLSEGIDGSAIVGTIIYLPYDQTEIPEEI